MEQKFLICTCVCVCGGGGGGVCFRKPCNIYGKEHIILLEEVDITAATSNVICLQNAFGACAISLSMENGHEAAMVN